jgi:hypothetical protein
MKFSKKGYLRNSPDVNKPQNIIQGGNITMKGVDFKVHGVDNNGYAKVMTPGYNYNFPNAKYVTETPIKKTNMSSPFQKKFSAKSPLKQEIDPTQLQYTTTNTATTLSGKVVPTGGEAVVNIPGQKVERYAQPGTPEYDTWQAAVEADPSIEDKYKDRTVTVTRQRDYSRNEDIDLNILKGIADRRPTYFPKDAPVNTQDSLPLNTQWKIAKKLNISPESFEKEYNRRTGKKIKFVIGNGKPNTTEELSDYKYDIRTGN